MAQVFRLPRIGDSLAEATVQEWNVQVGDTIGKDQIICSVETSKTIVEVPCPNAGVVLHLGGEVGESIELDEVLLVVGEAGESWREGAEALAALDTVQPVVAQTQEQSQDDDVQIFRLPRIGDSLAEATIQEWHVAVGDKVEKDQVICSAETSKTVVEVPCPYQGYVLHRGCEEGDVVELDDILIVIGEQGQSWSPNAQSQSGQAEGDEEVAAVASASTPVASNDQVLAMLKVRKLARDLGVDLTRVNGSGKNGIITAADVLAAVGQSGKPGKPAPAPELIDCQRKPMNPLRRAIAQNLERSWREIPHASMEWKIDISSVLAERKQILAETGDKVAVDALLMNKVIPLLKEFPEFNSRVDGSDLVLYKEFNVGFAVGSIEGLMVPVIKGADQLSVKELSGEITRLATAASERRLQPSDMSGLTFTLSNVGATGAAWGGSAIVPYGTAGMLSAGKALPTPVVVDGEVVIKPLVGFMMTYDHRAFDGAHVAAFFRRLQEAMEG